MTTFELEAFLATVHYGTITKAAENLYISQPAVSKRIALLERELGYKLIKRKRGLRSVELTDKGIAFIPIANQWMRTWERARDLATYSQRDILNIAASDGPMLYAIPDVIKRFISLYPNVYIRINALGYGQSYENIQKGTVDLAFTGVNYFYRDVQAIPVYGEKMFFICRTDSDYKENIGMEELSVNNVVFSNYSSDYEIWFKQWFKNQNDPLIETDLNAQMEDFLTSLGRNTWTIVPYSVADRMLKNPMLTTRKLLNPPPNRIIYYVYKTGNFNRNIDNFFNVLKDSLHNRQDIDSLL